MAEVETDRSQDQQHQVGKQQSSSNTNDNNTSTSTNINTSSSIAPTSQQDASQQPQDQQVAENKVKQFSDKSLQQLAEYYLNLEPANIPDTGFVVSGIAGRFPNADNLNELWDNLLNARDMVLGPDDKRWPLGK